MVGPLHHNTFFSVVHGCLEKHGNYEPLFTCAYGWLFYDEGKGWRIFRSPPFNEATRREYYENLAKKIVGLAAYNLFSLPYPEEFAKRFNTEWYRSLEEDPRKEKACEEEILFSSKAENYRFLSNFFPTLIFLPSKQNPFLSKFYFSVETAYATSLAFGLGRQQEVETLSICCDSGKAKKFLTKIKKAEAFRFAYPGGELKTKKEHLIKKLVRQKLECNPIFMSLLKATNGRELREETSDSFWGIGPDGEGCNIMGKILMELREEFNQEF